MTYKVKLSDQVKIDLVRLAKSEPKAFSKANRFIEELKEHPKTGTDHPEPLKASPKAVGAGRLQRSTDWCTASLKPKSMWMCSPLMGITPTSKAPFLLDS